ncbi:hypothetical protein AGMMS49521_0680 [Campylobacterota bacterium]|nr:hypothetical protein AGMMS49521_0680 [Campylobacterota bacterium]
MLLSSLENQSFDQGYEVLVQRLADKNITLEAMPRGEYYKTVQNEGIGIIKEHLPLYAYLHLKSTLVTLLGPGSMSFQTIYFYHVIEAYRTKSLGDFMLFLNDHKLSVITYLASSLYVSILYIFAIGGLIITTKSKPIVALLFVLLVGYFLVISGGGAAYSRFREPINFVFMIYGGIGISAFYQFIRARFSRLRPRRS